MKRTPESMAWHKVSLDLQSAFDAEMNYLMSIRRGKPETTTPEIKAKIDGLLQQATVDAVKELADYESQRKAKT